MMFKIPDYKSYFQNNEAKCSPSLHPSIPGSLSGATNKVIASAKFEMAHSTCNQPLNKLTGTTTEEA